MSKKPVEYIDIEVNGKTVSLRKGEILLWALRDKGYDIPHFCAHKWLEPFAGCRMCLVQIEMGGRMMPKLQPSCAMRVSEGIKVITEAPEVLQVRKEQLEFHLINHPLECPVCDKGGECMLQDQCYEHGFNSGRYLEQKRVREDKLITDYIRMNYKRCIQCKRCVHFCQDIDGSHLIKFVERGAETRIEGFPREGRADRFSGNTID
ncbi:MAG TPA: 2Fe-2S iron-sulfur cluster binding domain-containing protein, partial [Firmicutes bacterium]|nr:2Fe-2S iron-sulfur cluster binding domain-containing protein [Bacillota bacterium]